MQIRALLRKTFGNHQFFTNVGISFGLSGVGDLIEQRIERRQQTQQNSGNLVKKVNSINWSRTLHMSTAFGLTSGFLCHFWYNYLDRVLPGRGVRIIVQKIAWDQVNMFIKKNDLKSSFSWGIFEKTVPFPFHYFRQN